MTATSRRTPIFGPEPWSTVSGVPWCQFDRWFAIVAVSDFAGELDQLERELVSRLRSLTGRRDVEAKLSHLADLRARLAAAGIDVAVLNGHEPADKATLTKARRKVLDQALDGRAMTEAMRETPKVRLERRARYGHWETFPTNPDRWYDQLTGSDESVFVSKGQSHAATRQLRGRLARLDRPTLSTPDRLALHRAFHTVGLELADRSDDSYGNVGELRTEAFQTYVSIDWASTGMTPEHYWQDLCELVVSEVYALTYRNETLAFQRVPTGHAELIEGILGQLAEEWRAAYQDHQAEEALQLVAWLHLAGRRYRRYVDVARGLGSAHWAPIVALAESALRAGRHDLAVEIFRAADQPGSHQRHLRERCLALTGERLGDAPPGLRVVR